jgi:hypothetical protein
MTWESRVIDWDYWMQGWVSATCVTPVGKSQIESSIARIADLLGADYLQRCQQSPPHELLSMGWVFNQTAAVASRIFTFSAQIELLQSVKGWSRFQRDLRNDLGHFDHAMVQLEIAGFALRDGWEVSLEPGSHGQRSTDISLKRGAEEMFIEVKGFRLDSTTSHHMGAGRRLDDLLFQVHYEFGTWTTSHLAGDVTKLNLSDVNDRLRVAAAQAVESQRDVLVELGSEGELIVGFEPPKDGVLHSYQIQHADELGRITAQVREKAEQGRGVEPLWLRFNESSHFWNLATLHGKPVHVHEVIAQRLVDELKDFSHVAGAVLSAPPLFSSNFAPIEVETVKGQAWSFVNLQYQHHYRESLIARGSHTQFDNQLSCWMNWYRNESSWLAWAHQQLGLPDLKLVFDEQPNF